MHGCGDSSGMTGHHGWGYGQNDGRYRPRRPRPSGSNPRPSSPVGFPGPASPPPSGPDGYPHLVQSPEPRPPARPEPWLPGSLAKVRAVTRPAPPPASHPAAETASCRLLRAAPDCRAGPDLGPDTHSPVAGTGGGGGPGQRGAVGAERCARVSVRGARTACVRGPPGSRALLDKGAVSPGEFPRGSVRAFLSPGM